MGEVRWTEDQQKVIELSGRNILVSAAAGSGKTAVLVERIIHKVTDETNPCDIDHLLIVTFTKAAAAEMRTRIGKALSEKLMQNPENQHIQKQMSLLHSAQITTIHSFCQFLIRNYFHTIDFDPVYRVADENELKIIKQTLIKDFLEECYTKAEEEQDQTFYTMSEMFARGRMDTALESLILDLHNESLSAPDAEEWLRQCVEMYHVSSEAELEKKAWVQDILAESGQSIQNFIKMAKEARHLCMESSGPGAYLPRIEEDITYLEKFAEAECFAEYMQLFAGYQTGRLATVRGKEVDPRIKERVQALRQIYFKDGLQSLQKDYFSQPLSEIVRELQQMEAPIRCLISLTIEFGRRYAEKKREEGLIDFSDMEHFALEILTKRDENGDYLPSETAKELQEYFAEIMTDEYQDTNEVQEYILRSLIGKDYQKPYYFMVGDVKQSIYKFRMARPDIFLRKYQCFSKEESANQKIDLRANFRSRKEVLEGANYIFEQIMQKELGGIDYRDKSVQLIPKGNFPATDHSAGGKTELLLMERNSAEVSVDKKVLEAMMIGEKIREIMQGEQKLYVYADGEYRPVKYGDIAILLRSAKEWVDTFVTTFADMGIPAYAEMSTGYFQTMEVRTVIDLLTIIDNPRQDIPYVAVLRSYFGNITDEELAEIALMPEKLNFVDKVESYIELGENKTIQNKLSEFRDRINDYRQYGKIHTVYDLLQKIYMSGYYRYMSAMPAGEKRQANLDALLQHALDFASYGYHDIYKFVHYIESLKKAEIDYGEVPIDGEGADAVRIMTIHKSKGLEYPVVFVAGMGKQFNRQDSMMTTIIDGEYGLGCQYMDLEKRITHPTLPKKAIAKKMKYSMMAEEIRVLYVALTRAKEKLYITATQKDLSKAIQKWSLFCEDMGFYQLVNANKYTDWIVPAVLSRPGYKEKLLDLVQDDNLYSRQVVDTDSLFRLELWCPEDIISEQADQLMDDIMQKKQVEELDTDIVYDEKMEQVIRERMEYVYPYKTEEVIPVKMSVSEIKHRAMEQAGLLEEEKEEEVAHPVLPKETEPEIPLPAFMRQEKEISGAQRGTLYHLVMEHFPYQEIKESEKVWEATDYEKYFSEMAKKGYMTEQECRVLDGRKFVQFMETSIGQRMAAAHETGTLRLEQPFMIGENAKDIFVGISSEEMIMVQGIIDAFFFDGENIVLIDYKTDAVPSGNGQELAKKYQAQLDQYAMALERLTGKKVSEKIIYSFTLGIEIPLS